MRFPFGFPIPAILIPVAAACSADSNLAEPTLESAASQAEVENVGVQAAPTWRTLKPMLEARYDFAIAGSDGTYYVFGGRGASGRLLTSVERYKLVFNLWERVSPMPEARYAGNGAALLSRMIYVAGGATATGRLTRTLYAYNTTRDQWSLMNPLPSPSGCGGSVVIGRGLYVYSGCDNRLHSYSPKCDSVGGCPPWYTHASPPLQHAYPAIAQIDRKIYVAGGLHKGQPTNTLHIYDTWTDRWTWGTPMPEFRVQASGAAVGGKFYVVGGRVLPDRHRTATMLIYDPATRRWYTEAMLQTPPDLQAVLGIGYSMFMAGGRIGSVPTGKFLHYQNLRF